MDDISAEISANTFKVCFFFNVKKYVSWIGKPKLVEIHNAFEGAFQKREYVILARIVLSLPFLVDTATFLQLRVLLPPRHLGCPTQQLEGCCITIKVYPVSETNGLH